MNPRYQQLESQLEDQGLSSSLEEKIIATLPEKLKALHAYKVFGNDLLAIPTELVLREELYEYEQPFSFLGLQEEMEIFENKYRSEIPTNFIPFGYLYGASQIVLLNTTEDAVHIFHVTDIVHKDWVFHRLANPICSFDFFIKHIQLQSLAWLCQPNNPEKMVQIEVRKNGRIYLDYDDLLYSPESVWEEYYNICKAYIDDGFEILLCP